MDAVLVSHNGIGDNICMVGALQYLSTFYRRVYFICKKKYYYNIKLFFNNTNIISIPFNDKINDKSIQFKVELIIIKGIIQNFYKTNTDIFVCGIFKQYIHDRISNVNFLKNNIYNRYQSDYTIDYDTFTSKKYSFIDDFYRHAKLNLNVFYNYFKIPETTESIELFNTVKQYNIIFIQLKSSCGKSLNIENLLKKYLFDENTILLCNDINLYDKKINELDTINNTIYDDILNNIIVKRKVAESFVYNKLIYYYDTIINSNEIYIIDSCFIGIVLPLLKLNKLKANKVRIILRDIAHTIPL